MPTPREAYTNTVEQRGYGGERLQAGDFGAAGEMLGRAAQGFGQDLNKVAADWEEIEISRATDEARAADLAEQPSILEQRVAFSNLKGKAAMDAAPLLRENIKKQRAARAALITNPRARKMYEELATRRELDELPGIVEHSAKQEFAYKGGLRVAGMEQANNDAVVSYKDPAIVANSLKTIQDLARESAIADGITDDVGIGIEQRKATGKAIQNVASKMAMEGNALEAEAFLKVHEKLMDPDDYVKARTVFADDAADRRAENRFDFDRMEGDAPEGEVLDDGSQSTPAATSLAVEQSQKPIWQGRRVTSGLGPRWGREHEGLDLDFKQGEVVPATMEGNAKHGYDANGWGKYIKIDHGKDAQGRRIESLYAHLSRFNVGDGQRVRQGEQIGASGGRVGSTGAGNSKGEHLHYELLVDGKPVDPRTAGNYKVKGNPDDPQGAARPNYGQRRYDVNASIEAIKKLGLSDTDEKASIRVAMRRGQISEQARNRSEENLRDAYYAHENTLADPESLTSWEQLPGSLRTAFKNASSPQVENFVRKQIAANKQTAEARTKANDREVRGEIAEEAAADMYEMMMRSPAEFVKMDFTKQIPGLTRMDKLRYEDMQNKIVSSQRNVGDGTNFTAIREAVNRHNVGNVLANPKDKKGAAKLGRIAEKVLQKEEAFVKRKGSISPAEREVIVAQMTQEVILEDGTKTVRGLMVNGQRGTVPSREATRMRMASDRGGIPPTDAELDAFIEFRDKRNTYLKVDLNR